MKCAALLCSGVLIPVFAFGAQGVLSIEEADGLVSINADRVRLGVFLDELDQALGTSSTVPAELEAQTVSVLFSDLPLDEAVKKVFEGLQVDYAVIASRQIIVLAQSQAPSSGNTPRQPAATSFSAPVEESVADPLEAFRPPTAIGEPADAAAGRGGAPNNPGQPAVGGRGGPGQGQPPNPDPDPADGGLFGNTSPSILDLNRPAGTGDPGNGGLPQQPPVFPLPGGNPTPLPPPSGNQTPLPPASGNGPQLPAPIPSELPTPFPTQ